MGSAPPVWNSTFPDVMYQSNTSATPSLRSATYPSSDMDMIATTFDIAMSFRGRRCVQGIARGTGRDDGRGVPEQNVPSRIGPRELIRVSIFQPALSHASKAEDVARPGGERLGQLRGGVAALRNAEGVIGPFELAQLRQRQPRHDAPQEPPV